MAQLALALDSDGPGRKAPPRAAIAPGAAVEQGGAMHVRMPAILLAARPHGETAVVARLLTAEFGLVAGYVAGGRGRRLRPVVIPGNLVDLQLSARSDSQLPFARLELMESRGALLGEPLPAAAIGWVCAFTATVLPERQPYPALYEALGGLLQAIGLAPSARGWAGGLADYERLVLRELGYGRGNPSSSPEEGGFRARGAAGGEDGAVSTGAARGDDLATSLDALDRLAPALERYLLADRRGDVMAARHRLRALLGRML